MHPIHRQQASDVAELTRLIPHLKNFPENFTFPSTVDPHYEPTSNTVYVLVTAFFLSSITGSVVFLRLKIRSQGIFGMDDWLIIPAFLSYCLYSINNLVATFVTGFGYHLHDLSMIDIKTYLIAQFIHTIFWTLTIYLTRISILYLLLRLISDTSRKSRIYLYAVLGLSYAYIVVNLTIFIFDCRPLRATFDFPLYISGSCLGVNNVTLYACLCAGHMCLDLLTIIPPMIVIIKLNMERSKKINLFILMGLGLVSMVCTALRMFLYYKRMTESYDITWNATPVGFFGILEVNIVLIVACLPAINHIVRHYAVSVVNTFVNKSLSNHSGPEQDIVTFGHAGIKVFKRPTSFSTDNFTNITTTEVMMDTYREIRESESEINVATGDEKHNGHVRTEFVGKVDEELGIPTIESRKL